MTNGPKGPFDRNMGIVQRNDPMSGFFIIMLLMLALQVFGRRSIPEPRQILAILASFVVAVTIHEFMHAWTAFKLGDNTAERQGRITFNPMSHFEPFGFIGMVMISLGFNFIGWGKPVPVNPTRLRGGPLHTHRAMAIVAFAGPLSNVAQAGAMTLFIKLLETTGTDIGNATYYLKTYIWVNILLASFNMIPLPPLDGYKILIGLLPRFWQPVLAPIERYGFMILFLLFFLGGQIGSSLTGEMIWPVQRTLTRLLGLA